MDGGQVDTIYTDFSKAFDMVDHGLLVLKLRRMGIGGTLLKWFVSYITDRSQHVVIGTTKSFRMTPTSGIPQGSLLGPLLFLIFVNDIADLFDSKCLQLADDLKIFRKIDSVNDCRALQEDINKLSSWCDSNKMKLNVKKCKVLTTTHKKNVTLFDYVISNELLGRVSWHKDLGVIFDEKLAFNFHIDMVTRKAYQMLGFIFRACKRFSNPNSLIALYKAYVRSRVEYCSVVWSPFYDKYISQVERVQRKFTRMLFYKFNWTKSKYHERLDRCKLHLLETRRLESDELFLYKVIHGRLDTRLRDNVVWAAASSTRQKPTFYIPTFSSNVECNSPLVRMQRNHNDFFNSLDICGPSMFSFKRKVKSACVL